jgi:D-threo-aldose 1-dehydrogenase
MTPTTSLPSSTWTSLAPLGLGTAALGNLFQARSEDDAFDVLGAALHHGIDYIDTAPYYGHGLAEERIGRFLTQTDFTPTISTKVGRVLEQLRPGETLPDHGFINPNPFVPHFDYSAAGFEASLEGSIQRLGRDHIDVVLVHDLGEVTHGAAHQGHFEDALNSGFPKLAALKAAGAIGAIGLGVNEIAIIETVLHHMDIDVILLAGRHTLLDHSALTSGIFETCAARGVKVILGGVFNSGLLIAPEAQNATFDYATPNQDMRDRALQLANKCAQGGVALPAAALAYARMSQHVDRVLIGPGNLREWQSLQKWAETNVPNALLAEPMDAATSA